MSRRTDDAPMTNSRQTRFMRPWILFLLAVVPLFAGEVELPRDVAAQHPEGKWTIRTADLYRYLVRYYSGQPSAASVLPEYLKLRLVEDEARRRKISVSEGEVERWLEQLNERVMQQQGVGLDEMRKQLDMRQAELRRRGRQWMLYERVARAIVNEKDPSRDKDSPLGDDTVILVIDTLVREAPQQSEGLPEGVVARIRGLDITEYEYGRALSFEMGKIEVQRAIQQLVLQEEAALLIGNRDAPLPADLAAYKAWYIAMEKSRISRMPNAPPVITDDMLDQILRQRGLTRELVFSNPGFLAQARAIGHFRRAQSEEDLKRFYEDHREHYGDQLRVARILVGARAQKVPGVGRPIRTMEQGRSLAEDLYARIRGGQDFGDLATRHSEDPDVVRLSGGTLPFWITADRPDYADTWEQANRLEKGQISKPWFSQGRGFVIVKLLDRQKAEPYEKLRDQIRADAADRAFAVWRNEVLSAALVNTKLLDRD